MRSSFICTSLIPRLAPGVLVIGLGAVGPGCFVDSESPLSANFGVCENPAPEPVIDEVLTYYQDVKPIIDAKCESCHRDGGVGPFALTTYQDSFLAREGMRYAIETGSMPPWQPDDCCNNYRWDRSLSAEQRAMLLAWIDQGGVQGDEAQPAPPLEVDSGGLSRVDVTVTMSEPYTPVPTVGRDEVRCFLLDWPYDTEKYVTGFELVPGDRRVAHHAVVYTVSQGTADKLRARDGADGRPGWDCYGEFVGDGSQPTGSVGAWSPGFYGVEFPDGLGRKVPAGSALVLNMHYNVSNGVYDDQTSVNLMVEDQVDAELENLGFVNPLWLVEGAMSIEAGDPDASVFFSYDPSVYFTDGKPFTIYSVNIHMHDLGSIGRLAVLRADGTTECLLNITAWDFDWIGEYYLEQPTVINPGDKLYLECHWDNTAGNQRIIDGELQSPRNLTWGADKEMCATALGIRKSASQP